MHHPDASSTVELIKNITMGISCSQGNTFSFVIATILDDTYKVELETYLHQ